MSQDVSDCFYYQEKGGRIERTVDIYENSGAVGMSVFGSEKKEKNGQTQHTAELRTSGFEKDSKREVNSGESADALKDSNKEVETSSAVRNPQTQYPGCNKSVSRCIIVTAVCLLLLWLLLLAVVILLWIQFNQVITNRDQLLIQINDLNKEKEQLWTKSENLTEQRDQLLTTSKNLTEQRDQLLTTSKNLTEQKDQLLTTAKNLTEQRDQLLTTSMNLTQQRDQCLTTSMNLTEQKDQCLTTSKNLTEQRDQCLTTSNNLTAEKTQLQKTIVELQKNISEQIWRYKLNSSLYYFSHGRKNWTESRRDCKDKNADLVTINNQEELNFIMENLVCEHGWVGLSQAPNEGNWTWVDGTERNKEYWGNGQPDNQNSEDCAEILNSEMKLNDRICSYKQMWICEKSTS